MVALRFESMLDRTSVSFMWAILILQFLIPFSLADYVQWHLDNKGHEPIPGLDELPPSVLLKHVINAWRTSVELCDSYHDKREAASA